ncbi:hypothetical protein ACQR10_03615 [Bradyrhizobium sp. HKCCYLRH2060]|uniref:hypothetical protein n=1 Tax=Bradyrhizobium TaxID=374 RepID=UPI0029170E14|nr:hypothetical protein [Bradyrhizobium sp. SZCCHNR3003]
MATQVVSENSVGDKLQLLAVDLAVLLNRVPSSIDVRAAAGEVELAFNSDVVLAKLVDFADDHDLAYPDAGICAKVFGDRIDAAPVTRSLAGVLVAIQLARDHVDSILYLPQDIRERRLSDYAAEGQFSVSQFIFLSTNVRHVLGLI